MSIVDVGITDVFSETERPAAEPQRAHGRRATAVFSYILLVHWWEVSRGSLSISAQFGDVPYSRNLVISAGIRFRADPMPRSHGRR